MPKPSNTITLYGEDELWKAKIKIMAYIVLIQTNNDKIPGKLFLSRTCAIIAIIIAIKERNSVIIPYI